MQHYVEHTEIEDGSVLLSLMPIGFHAKTPFGLQSVGKFIAKKEYGIKRVGREDYVLNFTVSGAGDLLYRKGHYTLTKNTAVLIDCSQYHDYHTSPGASEPWIHYFMHIDKQSGKIYDDFLFKDQFSPIKITDSLYLSDLFEIIIDTAGKSGADIAFYLSNYISQVMTFLLECKKRTAYENVNHKVIVDKVVAYIESNYNSPVSIDEMSNYSGISKYYLIKIFKQLMHVTPYQYLLEFRIHKAKYFLDTTDLSISQIGSEVGFNDAWHFMRIFKKITGATPSEWREQPN